MIAALGKQKQQRTKEEVRKSIISKLKNVDNPQALEILDKVLDKPGIDKKLVKNKFFILNF